MAPLIFSAGKSFINIGRLDNDAVSPEDFCIDVAHVWMRGQQSAADVEGHQLYAREINVSVTHGLIG